MSSVGERVSSRSERVSSVGERLGSYRSLQAVARCRLSPVAGCRPLPAVAGCRLSPVAGCRPLQAVARCRPHPAAAGSRCARRRRSLHPDRHATRGRRGGRDGGAATHRDAARRQEGHPRPAG